MGCGCKKNKTPGVLPVAANVIGFNASPPPPSAQRVAVYEVVVNGVVQLSTTNPTAARDESQRLNGSIRVTSRVVAPAEAVPV